jgi:hypothetical protein
MCKVAFSWSTNKQEKGRVHNPHYYEWARANSANGEIPREPEGDECGVPRIHTFYSLTNRASLNNGKWMTSIFPRIYTAATETPYMGEGNEPHLTMDRLAYLTADITEKSWIEKVRKLKNWDREAKVRRELQIGTNTLLSELLISFRFTLAQNPDRVDALITDFREIVEKARLYINECIHNEFIHKARDLYDVYNLEWKYDVAIKVAE